MRLIEAGVIPGVIIVGVWNVGDNRWGEYLPQKPADTPQGRAIAAPFSDHLPGPICSDAYLKFLVEEVKPCIDAIYATQPDQPHTFVMGSSMGGLISLTSARPCRTRSIISSTSISASEVVVLKSTASIEFVPCPNGEFAVRYGALQYALPIAPERHAIKDYAVNDLHDYDIVPQPPAPAAVALRIDRDGWQIEIDPAFDHLFLWDQSALHLKNGSIILAPIGCTILRQASFGLR